MPAVLHSSVRAQQQRQAAKARAAGSETVRPRREDIARALAAKDGAIRESSDWMAVKIMKIAERP